MTYRVAFDVTEPWLDKRIPTDPLGFGSDLMGLRATLFATPVRRSIADPWFRPLLKIVPAHGGAHVHALDMRAVSGRDTLYFAEFKAARDGYVVLFVNDAVSPKPEERWKYYRNNHGMADVCIELVDVKAETPRASRCLTGSPQRTAAPKEVAAAADKRAGQAENFESSIRRP